MKALVFTFMVAVAMVIVPHANCQWKQQPSTGSPENRLPDRTTLAGQSGLGPLLTARLMHKEENAKHRRAVVEVQIDGVQLVEPSAKRTPKLDEGHIQYILDGGPVQISTVTTWSFENLSTGRHRIDVKLASNDDRPIGNGTTLKVDVP